MMRGCGAIESCGHTKAKPSAEDAEGFAFVRLASMPALGLIQNSISLGSDKGFQLGQECPGQKLYFFGRPLALSFGNGLEQLLELLDPKLLLFCRRLVVSPVRLDHVCDVPVGTIGQKFAALNSGFVDSRLEVWG